MKDKIKLPTQFEDFGLAPPVLKAVQELGYETPSPIQTQAIPYLLMGRDLVGQAQTGTGKTAAFALPLLSRLDPDTGSPQVLVLTPTRELAIQVAEAFQGYASRLEHFHILPIYGGQSYTGQLRQLKRGVQVVVGTPGRVMDHMRRGTLNLEALSTLVLDEADEMLRMGFIDDVEWILEQTPEKHQIALFSATMPAAIRKIAKKYLNNPQEVTIKTRTSTVETTNQRYWMVSGYHKLDALTRILEAEEFDAIIVFVRTKISTTELSEKLEARGYASAPLNGDIQQRQRERTIARLKSGELNILVATDVAARGLDVDRISHVINYDIPYDTEAYVHRIGRTGRMGRKGEAILFVAPREKRLLKAIEKATNQKIELMQLPSTSAINDKRIERFKARITQALDANELEPYTRIIDQYRIESNVPSLEIAAALTKLLYEENPLLLKPGKENRDRLTRKRSDRYEKPDKSNLSPETGMERYKLQVGKIHGVKPGNIVGAIANEVGLDSQYIGRIDIQRDFSTVDLPEGLPSRVLLILKKVVVAGQRLNLQPVKDVSDDQPRRKFKRRPKLSVKKSKSRIKRKKMKSK
ncbi:MAG: DEAD/DEAH box helicase [FCB group bacterium]|nr:DEAD/DEAH box helicase [FCB group bacterium]